MLRQEIKNLSVTPAKLRSFGLTMGLLLLVIAAYMFWREKSGTVFLCAAALVVGGLGGLVPKLLTPVYRAWMTLALFMGFVMTRVILTVLYLGLFTPIGVIARLLGKDLLQQRWHPQAQTYWVKRSGGGYKAAAAEKMF